MTIVIVAADHGNSVGDCNMMIVALKIIMMIPSMTMMRTHDDVEYKGDEDDCKGGDGDVIHGRTNHGIEDHDEGDDIDDNDFKGYDDNDGDAVVHDSIDHVLKIVELVLDEAYSV